MKIVQTLHTLFILHTPHIDCALPGVEAQKRWDVGLATEIMVCSLVFHVCCVVTAAGLGAIGKDQPTSFSMSVSFSFFYFFAFWLESVTVSLSPRTTTRPREVRWRGAF